MKRISMISLFLAGGLAACGSDAKNPGGAAGAGAAGSSGAGGAALPTTYTPFSEANLEAQRARVALFEVITTMTDADTFGAASFGAFQVDLTAADGAARCQPRTAPASGTIADAFLQNELCLKVVTRKQDHGYAAGTGTDAVGKAMHALISQNLQAGAAAADKETAEAAGEVVKKTLLRFFYESVYHEMVARSPKGWDEAFAYFGRSADGTQEKGFAATAKKRDTNFGTSFSDDIFGLLIAGRAELQRAVNAKGLALDDATATLAVGESPELERVIEQIDKKMLLVLAYSSAREFATIATEPTIAFAEAAAFYRAIQDYLASKDMVRTAEVTALVDQGLVAFKDKPESAQKAIALIESIFGIDATP